MLTRFCAPVLACWSFLPMLACGAAGPPVVIEFDASPEAAERLKKDVAELMAMDERAMLAVVPEQSGIYFTDCPNCDSAAADRGRFDWSPQRPHSVTCRDCGESYPESRKYPESGVLKVRSTGDEEHIYPYHERADGYRIYFRAHADYWASEYMAARCADLARLWWITRDERYAQRAALILVRFAEVYPGYALHYDYPFIAKVIVPHDAGPIPQAMEHGDGPTRTAKWSWWANMDISEELTAAYDVLRRWPPLAKMADGRAVERIERDLLGAMIDYVMGLGEAYDNMSPHKWRTAIEAARVLGRPEVVHDAVGRLEHFLDGSLLHDGSWMETSPSYMAQVAGNLQVIEEALAGYADPPDYAHPQTGRRLAAEDVAGLLGKRQGIIDHLMGTRLPDGRWIPVNDTWSTDGRAAREQMTPALSPGFGVAVLGAGSGEKQYHAWLNFTSGVQHKQCDALSIGLWAHGRELLSDIGYTHTAYRYWATSTASHNTVLVDGVDQQYDAEHAGNRLRAFATDGRGFHVVEAESASAYPQASRYRRTLVAVGGDAGEAYLVDVFQVHGGRQHDYLLAGDADRDSTAAAVGVALRSYHGTLLNHGVTFAKPTSENDLNRPATGLGFIRDLRHAPINGVTAVDFRHAGAATGVRTWLDAGREGAALYLGQAPSIRRSQGRDATLDDYLMPMAVARRSGENLRSTFVAVHEPVNGKPRIHDVRVQRRDELVRIDVAGSDGNDVILVALDGPASVKTDGLRFDGRYGVVRMRHDRVAQAHLAGGTTLAAGDVTVTAPADSYGGVVREVDAERRSLTVSGSIPADAPHSGMLLLRFADGTTRGYNVIRIEPAADTRSRIVVRESPGFAFTNGGVELTHHPLRAIKSDSVTYELLTAAHHADD